MFISNRKCAFCCANKTLYFTKISSFIDEITVLSSGCGGQRIKKKNHLQIFFLHFPSAKGTIEFVSMEQLSVLCVFMVLMVKILIMVNRSSRIVPA